MTTQRKDPTAKYLKQHFAAMGVFYLCLAVLAMINMDRFAQLYMDWITASPGAVMLVLFSVMLRMLLED